MSAPKCLQLCHSLCNQAEWTARTLSKAYRLKMAYNEETITENVLLALADRHFGSDLVIRAYTKPEEGTGTSATGNLPTGADWSFWFADGNNRGIELRIQAKRLFDTGKYESLNGNGTQIQKLHNNKGNAIPLYVFYNNSDFYNYPNFRKNLNLYLKKKSLVNWRYPLPFPFSDLWGCTYAPLTSIPKKNKPTYFDIPVMLPWHTLVCDCFSSQLSVNNPGNNNPGNNNPGNNNPENNNPKNLPQRIAASVKYAYSTDAFSEMKSIEFPQSKEQKQDLPFNTWDEELNFNADGEAPAWVELLEKNTKETSTDGTEDGAEDPSTPVLDNYLKDNDLRGVVFIRERPTPED
uniref:Uncharacterized protein n=1 Tax=Candidatus Nitrotoga fabula TaxID=2182327 RepID=A0A2X0R5E4_9PROT|nr:protein of unknown function [Candidatus Nitrotoga fabula]